MQNVQELEKSPQVVELQKSSTGLVEKANAMTVKTAEDMDSASSVVADLTQSNKRAEMLRKFFVDPLNNQVKNINAFFKEMKAPTEVAETYLRGQIANFVTVEREREDRERIEREKAEADAAKAREKKGEPEPEAFEAPVPEVPKAKTSSGRVSTKKVWKYEVENEKKIPREYLTPDLGKLRTAVRNGERKIAGIRIFEDTEVVVR